MTKSNFYAALLCAVLAFLAPAAYAGTQPVAADAAAGGFTIYFDNSSSHWTTPHIHYWGGASQSSWPGVAMTKVTGDVWKYEVTPGTTGCLFNAGDGDASKTADFKAVASHIYNTSGDQGEYSEGPVKPSVKISPDGGKVKEKTMITITIGGEVTSASATFAGKSLALTEGATDIAAADYLADGQSGTLEVTATNAVGTTTASASFYRDDTPVVVGPGKYLITDYYKVNPDGNAGTRKTIAVASGQKNGALTRWTDAELIAQGVARDICMAFKGFHERPIVDSYALYAAYDNTCLYLGVQMVYTVWDEYGEGFQPGESKPYNMDGKLMIAFDLDPEKECDGTLTNGASVWFDKKYTTFANGMDCLWLGSTKPGVGTPGLFFPNANGKFDYNDPNSCKKSNVKYGYDDGLLASIPAIWGQAKLGYDPALLEGNEGFIDLRAEVARMKGNDSAHTFYEFAFPLADLGITAADIEDTGIGVMFVDMYGSSAHATLPYDPCCYDNVKESYSQDASTSKEKEDEDVITYSMARVGVPAQINDPNGITDIAADADSDAPAVYYNLQGQRVTAPASGIYVRVQGGRATKVAF